jgi:hypothetical protein
MLAFTPVQEYAVTVQPGPGPLPWWYSVAKIGGRGVASSLHNCGCAKTREESWALALADVRKLIASDKARA